MAPRARLGFARGGGGGFGGTLHRGLRGRHRLSRRMTLELEMLQRRQDEVRVGEHVVQVGLAEQHGLDAADEAARDPEREGRGDGVLDDVARRQQMGLADGELRADAPGGAVARRAGVRRGGRRRRCRRRLRCGRRGRGGRRRHGSGGGAAGPRTGEADPDERGIHEGRRAAQGAGRGGVEAADGEAPVGEDGAQPPVAPRDEHVAVGDVAVDDVERVQRCEGARGVGEKVAQDACRGRPRRGAEVGGRKVARRAVRRERQLEPDEPRRVAHVHRRRRQRQPPAGLGVVRQQPAQPLRRLPLGLERAGGARGCMAAPAMAMAMAGAPLTVLRRENQSRPGGPWRQSRGRRRRLGDLDGGRRQSIHERRCGSEKFREESGRRPRGRHAKIIPWPRPRGAWELGRVRARSRGRELRDAGRPGQRAEGTRRSKALKDIEDADDADDAWDAEDAEVDDEAEGAVGRRDRH
ncbi:hypothetical protein CAUPRSCDRAFT_11603 [Caulochytrium protostelioides]|uniref:Uncharacterized protein n=1 Tax=Caulochytrium protostelioides TaxID=1555241 RepID=A0A4V1ITD8_9FUNG|nr:hypothetical protein CAUPRSCDRAFT_11603 [Caulochytrium protostelioides]